MSVHLLAQFGEVFPTPQRSNFRIKTTSIYSLEVSTRLVTSFPVQAKEPSYQALHTGERWFCRGVTVMNLMVPAVLIVGKAGTTVTKEMAFSSTQQLPETLHATRPPTSGDSLPGLEINSTLNVAIPTKISHLSPANDLSSIATEQLRGP